MQFSLATLSDLLSEFQKYLSSRISQATYYALGLVVVVLGALAGYIAGWGTVVNNWNGLDVFFKIVLSTTAGLTFFLLAYVLGSLQGAVERWFQGTWPRWLATITGQLRRHRTLWQERDGAFQEMMDLYSQISAVLNEVTQWALVQAPMPSVVQTKRPLPRYHIITEQDIELSTIDTLPNGAIQNCADVIGTMVQHPLDKGVSLTSTDVIYLPVELKDAATLAITVEASQAPVGLVPGDMVKVYLPGYSHRVPQFSASLVVDVQLMCQEVNGTKTDLIHLTLAVTPADIDKYVSFTKEKNPRIIVRTGASSGMILSTPAANNQNTGFLNTDAIQDVSQLPSKIEALRQPYEQGQQWLKRLRFGSLEAFSQRAALDEVNDLLSSLSSLFDPSAPNSDQLLEWSRQVNDYRNKWIDLLQQAFKEIEYRVDQNQKFFYLHYPATIEMVAPTSVGNIFRAVDSYCDTLYGLDTALVLPRLQIVMEQNTRDQLSKAHNQLSLLEWLYLASVTVGITAAVLCFVTHHYLLACLFWLLALPVPQIALYPAITMAALDYAAALRLAYDRERGKVISMVGFSLPSPANQEQEKTLWKEIQQWWVYGTSPGEYTLKTGDASNEKNT